MSCHAMDIIRLERMVEAHGEVCPVLAAADQQLCASYADTLVLLFRELTVQEHKNPAQFQALKHAYGCVAHGAMRYLDESGITQAVGAVAPLLSGFSFQANAPALAFESMFLNRMGIPFEKIKPFWAYVDQRKDAFIHRMCAPGFTLESLVDAAVTEYGTETGGEPWEHLSPGFWRRMAGFAIGVANATAAVPTCGLAVASIVVGAVGVAAG